MYRTAGNNYNVNFRSYYGTRVAIPPTTDNITIFPYDNNSNKFETSHYINTTSRRRASINEITLVLTEVDSFIKEYRDYSNPKKLLFIFLTCLLIILTSIIWGLLLEIQYLIPSTLFFTCTIAIIYIAKIFIHSRKMLEEVKQKVKEYLEAKSEYFEQKGLKWVIPFQFPNWMELWRIDNVASEGEMISLDPEIFPRENGRILEHEHNHYELLNNRNREGIGLGLIQGNNYPRRV